MEARVTQAGEAIGEHVKSATAATAAAAGQAQKNSRGCCSGLTRGGGQPDKKVLGDASTHSACGPSRQWLEDVASTFLVWLGRRT